MSLHNVNFSEEKLDACIKRRETKIFIMRHFSILHFRCISELISFKHQKLLNYSLFFSFNDMDDFSSVTFISLIAINKGKLLLRDQFVLDLKF